MRTTNTLYIYIIKDKIDKRTKLLKTLKKQKLDSRER